MNKWTTHWSDWYRRWRPHDTDSRYKRRPSDTTDPSFRVCIDNRNCQHRLCKWRRWNKPHLHNRRCWHYNRDRSSHLHKYMSSFRECSNRYHHSDTLKVAENIRQHQTHSSHRWNWPDICSDKHWRHQYMFRHFGTSFRDNHQNLLRSFCLENLKIEIKSIKCYREKFSEKVLVFKNLHI